MGRLGVDLSTQNPRLEHHHIFLQVVLDILLLQHMGLGFHSHSLRLERKEHLVLHSYQHSAGRSLRGLGDNLDYLDSYLDLHHHRLLHLYLHPYRYPHRLVKRPALANDHQCQH